MSQFQGDPATLHAKIGEHDAQIEALNTSVGEVRKAVQSVEGKLDSLISAINTQGNANNQFRTGQLAVWAGLILALVGGVGSLVMSMKDAHHESERQHIVSELREQREDRIYSDEKLDERLQREFGMADEKVKAHVDDAMALYISKHQSAMDKINRLQELNDQMLLEDRQELRELKHRKLFGGE